MDFDWWPYMNGFWMFPLFCLLFMVVMMFACGGMWSRVWHRSRSDHAREILDRRHASGEIGKAEYDAMLRDLR